MFRGAPQYCDQMPGYRFRQQWGQDFQCKHEILLRDFNSDNDSPKLKAELKKFVVEALQEKKIPRHQEAMLPFDQLFVAFGFFSMAILHCIA